MKRYTGKTPLRTTLRRMIGLHRGYVEGLITELERGARLGPWIEKLQLECAAAPELIGIILQERRQGGEYVPKAARS